MELLRKELLLIIDNNVHLIVAYDPLNLSVLERWPINN